MGPQIKRVEQVPLAIRQLLSFGLVGCIGFIVNAGIVVALSAMAGPGWAQVAGFPCAVFVTWLLNRRFTFHGHSKSLGREFSQYIASSALGAVVNNAVYYSLILKFSYVYEHPALAVAMGSICGMTLNFTLSKYYVYRPPRDPLASTVAMSLRTMQEPLRNILVNRLLICGAFFASMGVVFWRQIVSGFTYVIGDGYDGVIENVITTHWYWMLQGQRVWNEVGYFFPHTDTLGYNDSYLVYGLIASLFRVFTENQFLAVELAHVSIRAIGFFSFYKLARILGVSRVAATLGATIFTTAFSATDTSHAQFLLVSVAPLLFIFLKQALCRLDKPGFFKYAALTSVTYGMMALTGFYITYFTTLFMLTVLLAILCSQPSIARSLLTPKALKRFLVWIILFVACIAPFLSVYLPKLHETGGHPFAEIQKGMPHLQDIINIGDQSLLWGSAVTQLFADLGHPFAGVEMQHGFGLLLLATFMCGTIYLLYQRSDATHPRQIKIWPVIALSTVFWMLAIIDFGKGGVWSYIYAYVPGSKGLRIVSRMYLFLALPASLVIAKFFDAVSTPLSGMNKKLVLAVLAALLLIEQVNMRPHVFLDTREQLGFLKALPAPPMGCQYFYAKNPSGYSFGNEITDQYYRVNVRAMLVSSYFNLPTLIGFSSFNPPDWNFIYAPESTFDDRVYQYAMKHRITENLCVLDIKNRSWSPLTDTR